MKLPIAYYGDPILRKKASPVTDINDEIRKLVDDMIETMHEHDGIGLAAPQVHRSITLFITYVPIYENDEEIHPGTIKVYINPKIINYSSELWECDEGCLSIPGLYGKVTRPNQITVEATDLGGNRFTETCTGLEAHVIMHENDHINGVLFIDRIRGKERDAMDPILRQIRDKYYLKKGSK